MNKFKKGDKIICINTDNHEELVKDKIYEVEKPDGDFVYIKGCKYGYFAFLFRKKCEYCSVDEYNFKHNFIQDNKNKQIIYFPTSSWEGITKLHINHCPMCGRKLGGTKQ